MSASAASTRFRRLVLELGHAAADPATMREAAVLARLLGAELHALFVEDETLLHMSLFPFAREISPVSYQWRPLEADRLEAELRAAAERARQQLAEAARASGVRQNFEVRRGDLAVHVNEICVASDIVVVSPPRRGGGEETHGFRRLADMADRSVASVLFLPHVAAPRHGPIVAVASGEADPGLAVARRIAAQSHEKLVVLMPGAGGSGTIPLPGNTAQDISNALDDIRERLIVIAHVAPFGDAGAGLSALRGVPVLMVEGTAD